MAKPFIISNGYLRRELEEKKKSTIFRGVTRYIVLTGFGEWYRLKRNSKLKNKNIKPINSTDIRFVILETGQIDHLLFTFSRKP